MQEKNIKRFTIMLQEALTLESDDKCNQEKFTLPE